MVVGYESGNILVVEMGDILETARDKDSVRCQVEKPIFASPAHEGDGVLSVWRNTQGEQMLRVDTFDYLVRCHCNGTLTDSGAPIHDTKNKGVVMYEIIPADMMPKLQRYRDKTKRLGEKVTSEHKKMLEEVLKIEL